MIRYHLTRISGNSKTGPIPVSTTSADTCPDTCPLKASGGCYAGHGKLGLHWSKVSRSERGGTLDDLCESIRQLPPGQLWRHNQAGDLPGENDDIDSDALAALVAANKGRRGFTYSHKPVIGDTPTATGNRASIRYANTHGFRANLSANNPAHADALADLDLAPVVVVLPENAPATSTTPAGRKIIVCPAQQRDDITCASCQLCQRERSVIVGFRAHGAGKRKAEQAIATPTLTP